MAESCARSFGRYLRTLRERRGLALDDVASLSRSYADPVAKSYLSRVENGQMSLGLQKMIPLCRIYEIPTEALIERLELDVELDKIGAPDTSGLAFDEMLTRGKAEFEKGNRWLEYAFYRDSIGVTTKSALVPRFRDMNEQAESGWIMLASAAIHLGRFRFALHELLAVKSRNLTGPRVSALLLDRLSCAYSNTGAMSTAVHYADAAIELGQLEGAKDLLGYFYSDRAALSRRTGAFDEAIALHKKAFDAHKASDREIECTRSLYALAITYFHASRFTSCRRAAASAERLAVKHGQLRIRGLIRVLIGDLDSQAGLGDRAASLWREASEIARTLNDRELQFQADYYLYRQACEGGNPLRAKALRKKLLRIATWIRTDLPELDEFRRTAMSS